MITKEHKKHSDSTRPSYGFYGRNEWAIVGTHCSSIKCLAAEIIKALSPQYKCAYADAIHTAENEEGMLPPHLQSGAIVEYTNHAQFQQDRKSVV